MTPPKKLSPIFAGNWKMNHSVADALDFFSKSPKTPTENKCVLFVSALLLTDDVIAAARLKGFELGVQNVHWEEKGAFTGELSARLVVERGLNWCLLGHSERRQYFGESDESASRRLSRAVSTGLNTVYCIGETLAQREAGQTFQVIERQVASFWSTFQTLAASDAKLPTIAVAYEPVWAIGTGKTATSAQAEEVHQFIRSKTSIDLPILYGGSVTAENAAELISMPNINGVLVGGASLKAESFSKIFDIR